MPHFVLFQPVSCIVREFRGGGYDVGCVARWCWTNNAVSSVRLYTNELAAERSARYFGAVSFQ
jgi:hypothetical protein